VKKQSIEEPRISELKQAEETQAELADLFPTVGSMGWFEKQHKRELIAGGALYMIAGRLLRLPSAYRRVALEVGSRALAERHCRNVAPPA
jgi:uncharacterized membrane protein (UPF0136 family)